MSNSHLFLNPAIISTPLQNGVGRYIGQLQRVVLKFCKNHGSSRGMRLGYFSYKLYYIHLLQLTTYYLQRIYRIWIGKLCKGKSRGSRLSQTQTTPCSCDKSRIL